MNGKTLNLADNMAIKSNNFNVDSNGNMSCTSATIKNGDSFELTSSGKLKIKGNGTANDLFRIEENNSNNFTYIQPVGIGIVNSSGNRIDLQAGNSKASIYVDGQGSSTSILNTGIETPILTQTSLAESKKNFEKLQDNALETIKNIDIYKYNLKSEKDTDKKHIGFVIGDNYNYSKEVTSLDNEGVDNYSFTSLCCKAIQELSQQVEELKRQLKEGK